jgi:membrane fusion protein, multidrug efflux system
MTPIPVGFFLFVAIGLAGCNDDAAAPMPPRPVLTITVTPITTETFGPFTGTVEPRYQTQLGFQTAGRMVARDVYVGDLVKKGQRLAALDPTIPQFALARAKADVADADAQLTNVEGNASRQTALNASGSSTQAALMPLPAATPPRRGLTKPKLHCALRKNNLATPNSMPTSTASSRRGRPRSGTSSGTARRS